MPHARTERDHQIVKQHRGVLAVRDQSARHVVKLPGLRGRDLHDVSRQVQQLKARDLALNDLTDAPLEPLESWREFPNRALRIPLDRVVDEELPAFFGNFRRSPLHFAIGAS